MAINTSVYHRFPQLRAYR